MSTMMLSSEQLVGLGALPSRFDAVDAQLRKILSKEDQILQGLQILQDTLAQGQVRQEEVLQQILEAVTAAPQASKFLIDQQVVKKEK